MLSRVLVQAVSLMLLERAHKQALRPVATQSGLSPKGLQQNTCLTFRRFQAQSPTSPAKASQMEGDGEDLSPASRPRHRQPLVSA